MLLSCVLKFPNVFNNVQTREIHKVNVPFMQGPYIKSGQQCCSLSPVHSYRSRSQRKLTEVYLIKFINILFCEKFSFL